MLQGVPCRHSHPSRPGQSPLVGKLVARPTHNASCRHRSAQPGCQILQRHRAVANEDRQTEQVQLEGIDNNYCDEFVCTSSPQVEQNIKALARDLLRLTTYTGSLYTRGVKYKVCNGVGCSL